MAWWSLRDHQALTECMGIVMSFSKQRFLQAISRGNDHPASESFLPARKLFSKCFLFLFFIHPTLRDHQRRGQLQNL